MTTVRSYYPKGVAISEFAANEWNTLTLLCTFAAACVALVMVAKSLAVRQNPNISRLELFKALWSALCGGIHLILEGYYASHFATLQGSQHILAQLWKEYALSDSRYLTSDSFVMCMESITAFAWGPLSFLLAAMIVTDHPYRHPLQIIISSGQFYGDILYFGTCAFDSMVYGIKYSRPEAYYYYGYYVMMNGFWIIIPGYLIVDSVRSCARAYAEVKSMTRMNGAAKKAI